MLEKFSAFIVEADIEDSRIVGSVGFRGSRTISCKPETTTLVNNLVPEIHDLKNWPAEMSVANMFLCET
jgi:hypothetical protein